MSRAFVKEDQAEQGEPPLPDRPIGDQPNYVTPRGLKALQDRLRVLEAKRAEAEGAADADERAQALAGIDRDLRYVRARIATAIPVDQSNLCEHEVHFGSEVTIKDDDGRLAVYIIVGEDEADVARGLISWTSPLAAVLMNARQGDLVTWPRPSGDKNLHVVRVRNADLGDA